MNRTQRHTYRPGKNLTVSLVGLWILIILIGSILMFAPDSEEQTVIPVNTTSENVCDYQVF